MAIYSNDCHYSYAYSSIKRHKKLKKIPSPEGAEQVSQPSPGDSPKDLLPFSKQSNNTSERSFVKTVKILGLPCTQTVYNKITDVCILPHVCGQIHPRIVLTFAGACNGQGMLFKAVHFTLKKMEKAVKKWPLNVSQGDGKVT